VRCPWRPCASSLHSERSLAAPRFSHSFSSRNRPAFAPNPPHTRSRSRNFDDVSWIYRWIVARIGRIEEVLQIYLDHLLGIAPPCRNQCPLRWAAKLLQPHHWRRFRQPARFRKKELGRVFLTARRKMMTSSRHRRLTLPRAKESPAASCCRESGKYRLSHRAHHGNRMACMSRTNTPTCGSFMYF